MGNVEKVLAFAETQAGFQEDPGTNDWGPQVKNYLASVGIEYPAPWCFEGSVEILTENGWCRFSDLQNGVRVAAVDPISREVCLQSPARLIKKEHEGPVVRIKRPGFEVTCDPAHEFYGRWRVKNRQGSATGLAEKRSIYHLVGGQATDVTVPTVFSSSVEANVSDEDLFVLGILFADGYFHRGRIEASVSSERKIALMQNSASHVYQAKKAYGPRSTKPLTHFAWKTPSCIDEAMSGSTKAFKSSFLFSLSRRQASYLLDTVVTLDGHAKKGSVVISQSSKDRIDSLHILATLSGRDVRTGPPRVTGEFQSIMYSLRYSSQDRGFRLREKDVRVENEHLYLYCVEVSTGLIVVRPTYGKSMVVGNCASFVNFCEVHAGVHGWPSTGDTWAIQDWARSKGCYIDGPGGQQPERGDVFLLLDTDGQPEHTGFVTRNNGDGTHSTIEGNTHAEGVSSGPKGVHRKTRDNTDCKYVRWAKVLGA